MYKLKQIPEDFVVKEISKVEIANKVELTDKNKITNKNPADHSSRFIYCKLKKKNRTTLDAIKEIAKSLHLREKEVGFAGSKDKHALTEQLISLPIEKKEKLAQIKLENISVELIGYGNQPISLGDLEGNEFEIVVRNLEKSSIKPATYCENYFDEQRFSAHNVAIGKHLIKKEFQEAAKLIDEEKCTAHLHHYPHDFIGALKKLPLRLLRMYVNAYQSYLWNETAAQYLLSKGKVVKEIPYSLGKFIFIDDHKPLSELAIPVTGFASEELETEEIKNIISALLNKEEVTYSDFVIKQIPELSLEGNFRKVLVEIKDLEIGRATKDELNSGKKKIKLNFSLPKGSYATMVVRKIIS